MKDTIITGTIGVITPATMAVISLQQVEQWERIVSLTFGSLVAMLSFVRIVYRIYKNKGLG